MAVGELLIMGHCEVWFGRWESKEGTCLFCTCCLVAKLCMKFGLLPFKKFTQLCRYFNVVIRGGNSKKMKAEYFTRLQGTIGKGEHVARYHVNTKRSSPSKIESSRLRPGVSIQERFSLI